MFNRNWILCNFLQMVTSIPLPICLSSFNVTYAADISATWQHGRKPWNLVFLKIFSSPSKHPARRDPKAPARA